MTRKYKVQSTTVGFVSEVDSLPFREMLRRVTDILDSDVATSIKVYEEGGSLLHEIVWDTQTLNWKEVEKENDT